MGTMDCALAKLSHASRRASSRQGPSQSYNDEVTHVLSVTLLAVAAVATLAASPSPQSASGQGPRPFPGAPAPPATVPQPSAPPTTAPATRAPAAGSPAAGVPAATSAQAPLSPLETALGVSLPASAQLLDTYDAGSGQKYYIFGADTPYADVVLYYRTVLKSGGRELYRAPAPAMHQFDLGRFQEETMAFPPSVVVKDYSGGNPPGYLFVQGTVEKRFKTIIQVVPAPPAAPR